MKRTHEDMITNEECWDVPWVLCRDEFGIFWLDIKSENETFGGTCSMKIIKTNSGYIVDLTAEREYKDYISSMRRSQIGGRYYPVEKVIGYLDKKENDLHNYRFLTLCESLCHNEGGKNGRDFILNAYKEGWRHIQKCNGEIVWIDPERNPEYFYCNIACCPYKYH
jgi:hypothetical protein